ncbi:MAG: hypothetical protein PHR35_17220 [Kiritimatiellae bacterium]|nr:hypothetical protein [Kiritimatiellia bacterium]
MRYWWANQMRTYDAEVAGGYLWSRQRRADGSRNPFYENLRLTQTGDLVFGYAHAIIRAVGVVIGPARESPPPSPLGGEETAADIRGWMVDVAWMELRRPLEPANYMAILAPLLPEWHAPLTSEGRGIQGGRLLELPSPLALALLQLAGGRDPKHLVNPVWQPHQLRFSFAENKTDEEGGSGV